MKLIQVTLLVEDAELEERIEALEQRCEKINVSLQTIFHMTAMTIKCKPFVDILLSLSDIKIADIERQHKYKEIWNRVKSLTNIKNKNI